MTNQVIPEAAVEAAAKRAWLDSALGRRTCDAWEALTELEQTLRKDDARRILEAAAPHMLAGARDGERVLSRVPYYQARLIDGSVWIETKSLDELHEHCEGKDVTIQYLEVLTVETSWKPYPKYE